jgi:hypothetical protein
MEGAYPCKFAKFNRLFETSIDRCRVWGYANEVAYAEGFSLIKMLD